MDLAPPVQAEEPQPVAMEDVKMDVGEPSGEPSEDTALRRNAIHLVGVDDMSVKDIEAVMLTFVNKPFKVEWIDDTSLNIVYDGDEDALAALDSLFDHPAPESSETLNFEELRESKARTKNDEFIRARFARKSDKKTVGSRARSRYYLLHGEPSRKQDLARFGTKRSQPMLYGIKDKDIVSGRRRQDQVGDLFPMKAPSVALRDDEVQDLLPHRAKSAGRKRKTRRQRNREKPDLFASKLAAEPKKAADDKMDDAPSVYQNMDY